MYFFPLLTLQFFYEKWIDVRGSFDVSRYVHTPASKLRHLDDINKFAQHSCLRAWHFLSLHYITQQAHSHHLTMLPSVRFEERRYREVYYLRELKFHNADGRVHSAKSSSDAEEFTICERKLSLRLDYIHLIFV